MHVLPPEAPWQGFATADGPSPVQAEAVEGRGGRAAPRFGGLTSKDGSAPAFFEAFLRVDGFDTFRRLVRDESDARIEEILAFGRLRLLAGIREFLDRLDAQRGHQQRILLRGGSDDAL